MKNSFLFIPFALLSISIYGQAYSDSLTLSKYLVPPGSKESILRSNSVKFNNLFVKNTSTVLLFFSPDCDHCKDEIEALQKNMPKLQNVNLLLITNRPGLKVDTFIRNRHLDTLKNVKTILDLDNSLARFYGIGGYPSMVIYDFNQYPKAKYLVSKVPYQVILNDIYKYPYFLPQKKQ